MMEICPAGPPKLMKPSFSQNQKATRKLIGSGLGRSFSTAVSACLGVMSDSLEKWAVATVSTQYEIGSFLSNAVKDDRSASPDSDRCSFKRCRQPHETSWRRLFLDLG
jgi:hypothetical protein